MYSSSHFLSSAMASYVVSFIHSLYCISSWSVSAMILIVCALRTFRYICLFPRCLVVPLRHSPFAFVLLFAFPIYPDQLSLFPFSRVPHSLLSCCSDQSRLLVRKLPLFFSFGLSVRFAGSAFHFAVFCSFFRRSSSASFFFSISLLLFSSACLSASCSFSSFCASFAAVLSFFFRTLVLGAAASLVDAEVLLPAP